MDDEITELSYNDMDKFIEMLHMDSKGIIKEYCKSNLEAYRMIDEKFTKILSYIRPSNADSDKIQQWNNIKSDVENNIRIIMNTHSDIVYMLNGLSKD